MAVNKKIRLEVFDRFNGLCAYTGKPLGNDWQVDHVTPAYYFKHGFSQGDKDAVDNLVPSIRIINHYKRSFDLEQFRNYIKTLHLRIKKLPKNTKVLRTQKRKEYLMEVASYFDISEDKPFDGLFYFEKVRSN